MDKKEYKDWIYWIYTKNPMNEPESFVYIGCADKYHLINALRHIQSVCGYTDEEMNQYIAIKRHLLNHTLI